MADGSKAARDKGIVIVVEGYMDVIGLTEAGWENVVAPLGTALTEEQLHALLAARTGTGAAFDPDAAGERAALRAAERALPLLKPGFGLRFATLLASAGEDPDTVSRKAITATLAQNVHGSAVLSDFLVILEARQRRLEKAEHFAALEQGLRHYAERITDATARREFQRAFRALVRHIAVNRKQSLGADALPSRPFEPRALTSVPNGTFRILPAHAPRDRH